MKNANSQELIHSHQGSENHRRPSVNELMFVLVLDLCMIADLKQKTKNLCMQKGNNGLKNYREWEEQSTQGFSNCKIEELKFR